MNNGKTQCIKKKKKALIRVRQEEGIKFSRKKLKLMIDLYGHIKNGKSTK